MKVNEIITEAGVFDKLKSGVAGAVRGFKRSRSTREMMQHPVVQDAIGQWADYVKQVEVGGKDITKANYEQYLNAWLGKWLKLDSAYPGQLTDLSNKGVNTYIARAVAQRLSNTIPVSDTPEPAVSTTPRSKASTTTTTSTGLHPDVSVVSTTPNIILRYKKQDFVLDEPEGKFPTWYKFPTGRQVPKETRRFLNKQLQFL